jgi:hypothetical protein
LNLGLAKCEVLTPLAQPREIDRSERLRQRRVAAER